MTENPANWTPDGPLLPYPGHQPPKPSKLRTQLTITFVVAGILIALVVAAAVLSRHPILTPSTTHTVVYEATADAASGSGRTGMVTAQAPDGGTTQQTGLLPITGTFTFSSGDFVYLSVQNGQGLGSVTCRITVDGVVVSENTSDGGYTIATCQGRVS
jgi:hypothetical protein